EVCDAVLLALVLRGRVPSPPPRRLHRGPGRARVADVRAGQVARQGGSQGGGAVGDRAAGEVGKCSRHRGAGIALHGGPERPRGRRAEGKARGGERGPPPPQEDEREGEALGTGGQGPRPADLRGTPTRRRSRRSTSSPSPRTAP